MESMEKIRKELDKATKWHFFWLGSIIGLIIGYLAFLSIILLNYGTGIFN
jgi:hypothetical protein